MKIIKSIEGIEKPFHKAVITIGNFDGVHIGHQALFHEVIEKADSLKGTSVALTFDPHPIRVLAQNNHPPLITLLEQKTELIAKSGIDVLVCVPFTPEFASLTAKTFIEDILVQRIGMKVIVVGQDYTFGKNREGNVTLLKEYAGKLGFELIVPHWILAKSTTDGRISSTGIRQLVTDGRMGAASRMLGRDYQIRGSVTTGRNRGAKLLGFPTANITLQDELCPKRGIYAVTVEFEENIYPAVANIGFSPTFDDHLFTVEVHILDFNRDIYNKKIRINFVERLRDEIKFANVEELADQIRKDIEVARKLLA
ncbi:MAG: bifunctional riboflavin kinase/FAD synthetase [Desulfobacteraceae bacterium]|nr:bifunctional riboflavin kinase/FAD synthetase [Desulfobacteraceae bacterium]